MEISGITNQLIEEYTKKIDKLIRYKLSLLQVKAEESGDMLLASLLYRLGNENNIEEIAKEIEKYGYKLEFDSPQPEFNVVHETNKYLYRSIIDIEKVKVRVIKVIAEV